MFRSALLFIPVISACVDFSSFQPGDIVSDLGNGVRVEGSARLRKLKQKGKPGKCMIFDSSNPSGGDFDLGTPNEAFGGPGIGSAGAQSNFPNPTALGNVLILSEDGDSSNPDDNKCGGSFRFFFDPPRYVATIGLLDTESQVRIMVYTTNGVTELRNSGRGDNSFDRVFIGLPSVSKIIVKVWDSAAITDIGCPAIPVCQPEIVVDFENFQTGAAVSDLGNGISVTANRYIRNGLELADAMIFDSSSPSGGDNDLGTPHESVGGPGKGDGGQQGRPFENVNALGKILIISEDGDSSDPDDEANGGVMDFTFDHPLYISDIGLLDIEEGALVCLMTEDGKTTKIDIPGREDNSFETVQIQLPAVIGLSIDFAGSAALAHINASTCVNAPVSLPAIVPSPSPKEAPVAEPSAAPSMLLSAGPSAAPLAGPSNEPSPRPSIMPLSPSAEPSAYPSSKPRAARSRKPSVTPSIEPSRAQSVSLSDAPIADPSSAPSVCKPDPVLDFDMYDTGDVVRNLANGIVVTASLNIRNGFKSAEAMIFDSSFPTGGDADLGTPHESVGGPGKGNGGQQGRPYENVNALGKVLIISEDGDSSDPDDAATGGKLDFTFASPIHVHDIGLLDNEEGIRILATKKNGKSTEFLVPGRGDNSYEVVPIKLSKVTKMSIEFGGSAALAHITTSPCV